MNLTTIRMNDITDIIQPILDSINGLVYYGKKRKKNPKDQA